MPASLIPRDAMSDTLRSGQQAEADVEETARLDEPHEPASEPVGAAT